MDGMGGMGTGSTGMQPLTTQGVDFSNVTQATDFLGDLLDDSVLQVIGNKYARYFWYGTVVFIVLVGAANLFRRVTLSFRLRQAVRGRQAPARPSNVFMRIAATTTAMCREATYPQITPVKYPLYFKVPPFGQSLLIVVYIAFVLALQFVDNNIPGAQYTEGLGIRAAWLAIAQVPLLILLIGKYNWIGLITGIGYERLNVFHRWVSRMLLLLATFHFGFQAGGWDKFPGIFQLEWSTDICVPTGLATYVLLIWMNLSTLAPIRNLSYELFVAQHIITFFGFIIALMIHLPTTALYSRTYIYIPIGLYLFDRLVRFLYFSYVNVKPSRATIEALAGGATRITFQNPRIRKWTPGSHVLVSFPTMAFGQNHPATILSTPDSHNGELVLVMKALRGFTNQLYCHASKSFNKLEGDKVDGQYERLPILADGPFGGRSCDFAAFDSICFIAGSTGITFVLANLLDLASRAVSTSGKIPLRRADIVWCVKSESDVDWVSTELTSALHRLHEFGIEVDIGIYVTCSYGSLEASEILSGCKCDKSLGSCCCIQSKDKSLQKILEMLTKKTKQNEKSIDEEPAAGFNAEVFFRRPVCRDIIERTLFLADGETAVAVCGPLGMTVDVRNAVAALSDQRGVHKGTGAQGVYLHAEGFAQ